MCIMLMMSVGLIVVAKCSNACTFGLLAIRHHVADSFRQVHEALMQLQRNCNAIYCGPIHGVL